MVQGTGSDVGKSLLCAGLCRVFTRRGLGVAPFKPQNMSNNAAVTADGGEIGRAQALQARACHLAPDRHMNPVLLKPQADNRSQIIVQGRRLTEIGGRDYQAMKAGLMKRVMESFAAIGRGRDLVIVEGAGSAAEVNLRNGDIANMGFALAAAVPVVLVGDIDRGGVLAALVGTHALLGEAERALVKGFIVNKFRGDPGLFADAPAIVESRCGWRSFGLVPWFAEASRLPAEDSASLPTGRRGDGAIRIAVLSLPRIANFDDFDPLAAESDVRLDFVGPGETVPADADLVILPGSKSTIADLAFVRAQGWDIDVLAHRRRGGAVLGLCAGYQMLGHRVADPQGIEGPAGAVPGLGLLDVETIVGGDKVLRAAAGTCLGHAVRGYEMHMGRTSGPGGARPFVELDDHADGAVSPDGRVMGSYLHGLFAADGFRHAFLSRFRRGRSDEAAYETGVDAVLDRLADHLEAHIAIDDLWSMAAQSPNIGRSDR